MSALAIRHFGIDAESRFAGVDLSGGYRTSGYRGRLGLGMA
jgi:hypothetical protein